MLMQDDIDYFNRGKSENAKYWARLGGQPSFKDTVVLDVGCGHGSLCIDAALAGAKKVVGLDLDIHRIAFANENLVQNYPSLIPIVEFKGIDLNDYSELEFDIILSKDSFEHIIALEQVLSAMIARLKKGGHIYIGFAPLYRGPFGDHGRTKLFLPWAHVILSDEFIINRLNRKNKARISSIYDLGLNKMSLADYHKLFNTSGMKIVYLHTNVSNNLAMKLFNLISKINPLKEYFTHNLYCILEKL
jgi:2-polyprenyl-3-methyl-5-hydroxy-6-metoxy-1,4-benzoquinol methylase